MGISSIWSALVSPRVKEITPHRPFSFEASEHTAAYSTPSVVYGNHAGAVSEVIIQAQLTPAFEEKKAKRRSRAFSLSSKKSDGQLKKRKSWFGGKPAAEDAPAVPSLPQLPPLGFGQAQPRQLGIPEETPDRPGTALTTDDPVSWSRPATPQQTPVVEKRKSKRMSLGGALLSSKRRRQSALESVPQLERRQSVFGGLRDMQSSTLSTPKPPSTSKSELINPETGVVPSLEEAIQKKGRRKSISRAFSRARSKSNASTTKSSRRKSWWSSSNPDDDEIVMDAPPLPALPPLIHDDGTLTPDSSVANTASPDNSDIIDHLIFADSPMRTVTRGTSIKQPRPVSGVSLASKRSYTPKSAATGFLKSTGARSDRRHSLLDDGDNGMICLSDEQQREWDKLKHLMETMERRQDRGVMGMLKQLEDEEDRRDGVAFSNAQALAALEFGTAK